MGFPGPASLLRDRGFRRLFRDSDAVATFLLNVSSVNQAGGRDQKRIGCAVVLIRIAIILAGHQVVDGMALFGRHHSHQASRKAGVFSEEDAGEHCRWSVVDHVEQGQVVKEEKVARAHFVGHTVPVAGRRACRQMF